MLNADKFPALSEIGWGPYSTVYESSMLEDGTRLIVKNVRLFSAATGFSDGLPAAGFTAALQRQKRLAAGGCRGVAPVVDFGLDELSGYYVTHRYDRSLQDWIQRKVQPSAEVLRSVCTNCFEVLQGVSEADGLAHGNLKPSNVLCNGNLPDLDFALTDLGATGSVREDLEALGKILYQLVARREIQQFDWPLADSNEWKLLQGEAAEWRRFCNQLLDQSAGGRFQSFAEARAAIPQPRKTRVLSARSLVFLGLAVALGGLAFFVFNRVSAPPEAPVAVQEWYSLCDAYNAWFGEVCDKTGWQAKWEKNGFLNKQLVSPLRKLAEDRPLKEIFNPRNIMDPQRRAENRDLRQFASDLPGLSREGLHQTHASLQAVSLIQEALENWRRTELSILFEEVRKAGAQSSVFDAVSPIPWDADLFAWTDTQLGLLESWNAWKQQAARLNGLKDPFFRSAAPLTIRELELPGGLGEMSGRLQGSAAVLGEWANFLTQYGDQFEPSAFSELLQKFQGQPLNGDVLKQITAAASGILEKPAQWLAELEGWRGVGNSAALQTTWRTRKEAALRGVNAAALERDRPRFRALKVQFERLDFVLKALDAGLPVFSRPPAASDTQDAAFGQSLLKVAAGLREDTASQLAAALPANDVLERANPLLSEPGLGWGQTLVKNYETLGRIAEQVQRLGALLREGAPLEQGVEAAAVELQARLKSHPAFQPLAATPEAGRLLTLVDELRQVAKADATQLAAKVQSPSVSVSVAALLRRGQILPAKSLADWRSVRAQCSAVQARIQAAVFPPEKRAPLAEQIATLQTQQWLSALHLCPKEDMLEMAGQRAEAGIPETALTAADRYNLLLLGKQALLAANRAVDVAELRDGLLREVEKLGGFSDAEKKQADRFLAELRAFSFSANRKTAQSDRGPGQRGWHSNPDSPESLSWQGHTLRMIRVEQANGTSFFLANKAVSVGLVADWLKRSDSRAPTPAAPPPNRIPSVWVGTGRNLAPAADWFGSYTTAQFPKTAHYPEGFSANSRPQNDTPMVYLSAENAAALAKDMGFRLPTESEWRRALEHARVRDAGLSTFNLRDATWNQEQEHLKNYSTAHALDGRPAAVAWLDGAIFRPDPSSVVRTGRQNAVPVHSGRDGFLWFAPVHQGGETGGFFHLLGNVAHYVTKAANEDNYLVVGSSALSEPGLGDAPHPVSKSGLGFADVGFRLALDAEFFENPEVTRFKETLRKTALLTRLKE